MTCPYLYSCLEMSCPYLFSCIKICTREFGIEVSFIYWLDDYSICSHLRQHICSKLLHVDGIVKKMAHMITSKLSFYLIVEPIWDYMLPLVWWDSPSCILYSGSLSLQSYLHVICLILFLYTFGISSEFKYFCNHVCFFSSEINPNRVQRLIPEQY